MNTVLRGVIWKERKGNIKMNKVEHIFGGEGEIGRCTHPSPIKFKFKIIKDLKINYTLNYPFL